MHKIETHANNAHACVCRELEAFLFVFEAGNRIVMEKPKYSHATYFFEIEEPLPISCQVNSQSTALHVSF